MGAKYSICLKIEGSTPIFHQLPKRKWHLACTSYLVLIKKNILNQCRTQLYFRRNPQIMDTAKYKFTESTDRKSHSHRPITFTDLQKYCLDWETTQCFAICNGRHRYQLWSWLQLALMHPNDIETFLKSLAEHVLSAHERNVEKLLFDKRVTLKTKWYTFFTDTIDYLYQAIHLEELETAPHTPNAL